MSESGDNIVLLPESLSNQLRAFEKRLRRMETAVTVSGVVCGLLGAFAAMFISDRLWDTPIGIRILFALLGALAAGASAAWWLWHWWWRRRDNRDLAKLIQKEYARLGDRLLGVVELADGRSIPANISPALCRAAIAQVARESDAYDFKKAVRTRRSRRYAAIAIAVCAAVAAAFFAFPEAWLNSFVRWTCPVSGTERYTFVSVEGIPGEQVVPYGESFEICCTLTGKSRWIPPEAGCRFEDQPAIVAETGGGRVVFKIPGQTKDGILRIRIGDMTKKVSIRPLHRPELRKLTASVRLPDYLSRSNMTAEIQGNRLDVVEGSEVSFRGVVSRELGDAGMQFSGTGPVYTAGATFRTAMIDAGVETNCVFSWRDVFGLAPAEPYRLELSAVKDEAPLVECRGLDRSVAILEDEIVRIEGSATDDFGLREMAVNWKGLGSVTPDLKVTKTLASGTPHATILTGEYKFSPVLEHVPEDGAVSVWISASDYRPGSAPAVSMAHRIYVLSRTKHAKLLQEQFERLQNRIEEIAREEERLLDANRGLTNLPPSELSADKTTREIKENETSERSSTDKLARLAAEGANLVKEGMRNRDVGADTLSKWAGMMEDLKDLSECEMKQSVGALEKAGKDRESRKEELASASRLEEKILQKLREAGKGIGDSVDGMLSRSFINRLLEAASAEDAIGRKFTEILPSTVGAAPGNLPADKAAIVEELARKQESTRREMKNVEDDLLGFHNRTRLVKYNVVRREMTEKQTQAKLGDLVKLIRGNIAIRAIEESESWKNQFTKWAEMLGQQGKDGEGSGECEGDGLSEMDTEILISLIRIRQREEGLREQTRLLEEARATSPSYGRDAGKVADKQAEVAKDTSALERRSEDAELRKFIEVVSGEMMNVCVFLRRPQTDTETVGIETAIIEMLSDQMGKSSEKPGASRSSAGRMLRRMMGKGTGKTGGGSTAGGDTNEATGSSKGAATGGASEEDRNIEKTGGLNRDDMPEEFKEALDAYFDALEETP